MSVVNKANRILIICPDCEAESLLQTGTRHARKALYISCPLCVTLHLIVIMEGHGPYNVPCTSCTGVMSIHSKNF